MTILKMSFFWKVTTDYGPIKKEFIIIDEAVGTYLPKWQKHKLVPTPLAKNDIGENQEVIQIVKMMKVKKVKVAKMTMKVPMMYHHFLKTYCGQEQNLYLAMYREQ